MQNNHLQKYQNSETSKIRLYRDTIWEDLIGGYLNKLFDGRDTKMFDFDSLYDIGDRFTHEGQAQFHKSVVDAVGDPNHSEDYYNCLSKSVRSYFIVYSIGAGLAPLAALPIPLLLEDYLNWLKDESGDNIKGVILSSWICLFNFLQIFLFQIVWSKFSKLTTMQDLLNKVVLLTNQGHNQ